MYGDYSNDALELEIGDTNYLIAVNASAKYSYYPGRAYMPNGDPGYPDECDFEITDVESYWFEVDENGNETEVSDVTREMECALEEHLYGLPLDVWQFDPIW